MTYHRKNNGKGGFTLVELVVVIAVIAILAAIAIPMVAGIIDNATKTSDVVAANEIDKACMEYKTGIIWGIINSDDKNNSTQPDLPLPNSAMPVRVAAVKSATVKYAVEFAGITKYEDRISAGDFAYNKEGRILAVTEHPEMTDKIDLDTTLALLYYS